MNGPDFSNVPDHCLRLELLHRCTPWVSGNALDRWQSDTLGDRFRFECEETLKAILNAGGIPVLAHPLLLGIKENDILEDLIAVLTEMGLKGIEVYYPEHTKNLIAYYSRLATHYNLLITGGTDFHGGIKPEIKMGVGKGDFFVPYELYEKLISRL